MERANVERLSYIDTLRGVAACAVMYQHVVERSDLNWLKPTLDLSPGLFGVVLFFLLSGYVIPLSVRGQIEPWRFAVRRVFRIFPTYYFLLLLIYALPAFGLHVPQFHAETLTASGWLANLFLVQDFTGHPPVLGVSWTLIIEIAWYALFLGVFLRFEHRRVTAVCVGFTVFHFALGVASWWTGVRLPLGRVGLVNAALLGYAAFAYDRGLLNRREFAGIVSVFVATIGLTQWVGFGHFRHPTMTFQHGVFGWSLPTLLFLAFVVSASVRNSRLANLPALRKIGETSYSVYLVHGILLELYLLFVGASYVWLVVPVLTFACSLPMFRFVEKNGIKLGRTLTSPQPIDATRPSLKLSE